MEAVAPRHDHDVPAADLSVRLVYGRIPRNHVLVALPVPAHMPARLVLAIPVPRLVLAGACLFRIDWPRVATSRRAAGQSEKHL